MMNRTEVIRRVAKKNDIFQYDIEPIVNSTFDVLKEMLLESNSIYIHDFGKFELKVIPAKTIKHPVTQEPVALKKHYGVSFTALPKFKEQLQKMPMPD